MNFDKRQEALVKSLPACVMPRLAFPRIWSYQVELEPSGTWLKPVDPSHQPK